MSICSVPRPIDGRVAIVTGGASGIGAATVALLRGAGARVAVLDIQQGSAPAELYIRCDISVEEEVVGAVSRAHDAFGGLDVAVLNAGVGGFGSLLDLSSAEWDRVLGVNLRGTFVCLREVGKAMVAGGRGGAIVAVSSISGFLADRMMAHYSVSKAGVAELVRVAARELGPFGIRVNAVAPGTTDTPMFASTKRLPGYRERVAERAALGDVGTPDGVARAVTALLELDWVTGQVLAADGGVSLWSPIDPAESMGT
jgi:NAD(P)-dependent dehydrogenase (short-subunit alcohol dehydrogenase family)